MDAAAPGRVMGELAAGGADNVLAAVDDAVGAGTSFLDDLVRPQRDGIQHVKTYIADDMVRSETPLGSGTTHEFASRLRLTATDVERLLEAFRSKPRSAILLGEPGVGKTALLADAAHAAGERFEWGRVKLITGGDDADRAGATMHTKQLVSDDGDWMRLWEAGQHNLDGRTLNRGPAGRDDAWRSATMLGSDGVGLPGPRRMTPSYTVGETGPLTQTVSDALPQGQRAELATMRLRLQIEDSILGQDAVVRAVTERYRRAAAMT